MDSKHFKTDKDQQIEKMKRYHPIGFSAFAFVAICPHYGTLSSSASNCHLTFNKFLWVCVCVCVQTWG